MTEHTWPCYNVLTLMRSVLRKCRPVACALEKRVPTFTQSKDPTCIKREPQDTAVAILDSIRSLATSMIINQQHNVRRA